ncbi:MAG: mechanosensitive ion channel domain-containing protein [Myxococcota bacterium]
MTFTELLWRAVGALAIVGGSALVGGWVSVIVSMAATRRGASPETTRSLETGIPVVTVGLGAVIGLEFLFGLPMISLGATFAAVLLAVGLASVPLLANVAGGVAFRLRQAPKVGASLRSGGYEGAVTSIDWLGVRIASRRDSEVLVPWLWILVRPTEIRGDGVLRPIAIPLVLGRDTELDEARQLLVSAVLEVPGVLAEPEPDVIVREVTARGISVLLRASVEAHLGAEVRSAVVEAIISSLRDGSVEVAA